MNKLKFSNYVYIRCEDKASAPSNAPSTSLSASPSKSCENQVLIYETHIADLEVKLESFAHDRWHLLKRQRHAKL